MPTNVVKPETTETYDPEEWVCSHYQVKDFPTFSDLLIHKASCINPNTPKEA